MKKHTITCGLLAVVSISASLQLANAQPTANSIRLGDTSLTPSVTLTYFTDDNALRRDTDTTDNTGFILSPSVEWGADFRTINLSAEYQGDFQVSDEDATDFTDHALSFRCLLYTSPSPRDRG